MKKAMIIGGLGFIGSYLAKKCVESGYEVTILSRSDSKIENIKKIRDSVNLILMDVKDIGKEVEGFDCIFHLAGSTDNYAITENQPYKDIEMNCNSTIALLEACKKYNTKARIIFASTFFVNGNLEKLPATPDSPCNPLGLYGATRLAAEHFCRIYHKVFDMDIIVVRFTNVFGAREQISRKKAGFNYLIKLAVEGKEIPLYNNGDFIRDYIYVSDAADACLIVAEKGKTNETYYIGRGESIKFKQMIDIVVNLTKAKIKSVSPPNFHKRVGIIDFVCDNKPLKSLGWTPTISLEEGIKKTIEYYKK